MRTNERAERAEAERAMWKTQEAQQIPLSVVGCSMAGEFHNASEQNGLFAGYNVLYKVSHVNTSNKFSPLRSFPPQICAKTYGPFFTSSQSLGK